MNNSYIYCVKNYFFSKVRLTSLALSFVFVGITLNVQAEKIDSLINYAWAIKKRDPVKALEVCKIAELQFDAEDFPEKIGLIRKTQGIGYLRLQKYDSAIYSFEEGLQYFLKAKDSTEYANVLFNISLVYQNKKELRKALEYVLKVIDLDKKADNLKGLGYDYNDLGLIYKDLQRYDTASFYFHKSLNIRKSISHYDEIGYTYLNLGNLKVNTGDFDSANLFFKNALKYFRLKEDTIDIAKATYSIGNIFFHKEMYDSAEFYYLQTAKMNKKHHIDQYDVVITHLALALVAEKKREYIKADSLFKHTLAEANKLKLPYYLSVIYQSLHKYHAKKENHKKAYEYLILHMQYEDSVNQNTEKKKIAEIESSYNFQLKNAEIDKLKSEKELIEMRGSLTFWGSMILILIFLMIVSFMLFRMRVSARTLVKINQKNKELRSLNDALDQFVSIASHDLKAPIASAKGLIKLIKMEPVSNEQDKYLELQEKSLVKLEKFIGDMLDYSRDKKLAIEPEPILFDEFVDEILSQFNLIDSVEFKVVKEIHQKHPFYSDKSSLTIIFSNLISNAYRYKDKHKDEPFLKIQINITTQKGSFVFSDNGIGIPKDKHHEVFGMFKRFHDRNESSGLGLYLVKQSTDKLMGRISFSSKQKQGTTFFLELPNLNEPARKNESLNLEEV